MTIGSILLGSALLLLVGLYVAQPLLKPEKRRRIRRTRHEALVTQKEAVLTEIKALEFDYETGKLLEDDYNRNREALVAEATLVLQELDELEEKRTPAGPVPAPVQSAGVRDADIEAAIALRRVRPSKEEMKPAVIAAGSGKNGKTHFCPQCGRQVDPDDKFCVECGHQLIQTQPV